MAISKKTVIKDTENTILTLMTALNNNEFVSKAINDNGTINFILKYGLQKVKCSLSLTQEGCETSLLYSAKTNHDVIFSRGLEILNDSLAKNDDDWASEKLDTDISKFQIPVWACFALFGGVVGYYLFIPSQESLAEQCVEKNLAPYNKTTDKYVNTVHSFRINSIIVDKNDSNLLWVNYNARIRTESGKHREITDLPTYDLACRGY